MNAMKKYWEDKLCGSLTPVNLDTDFSFSADSARENYEFLINEETGNRVLKIGKNRNLPVYTVLLAVFKIVILNITRQNDIIITSPLYDESEEAHEGYVILRDYLDHKMTFREILNAVRQTVIGGYGNQEFPVRYILDEKLVHPETVMKVIIYMECIHNSRHLQSTINSAQNNLSIAFSCEKDRVKGIINYNSKLFSGKTIRKLAALYHHILNSVTNDTDTRLMDLDLILKEEKKLIMETFNKTESVYPAKQTIHRLFEEGLVRFGNNIAVESGGISLTYNSLNRKADQLAGILRARGVKPGHIIGLMTDRSVYMLIGIFGILKAGGAFLPLDPDYPSDRLKYMLDDSEVNLLLTRKHMADISGFSKNTLFIDNEEIYTSDCSPPENINTGRDLAYIIYTSGSTGKPKGVLIEHRNVINYAVWRIKTLNFTSADITANIISFSFDGFGANFYPNILSGGKLIIPGNKDYRNFDYIRQLIDREKVTNIGIVPSMYKSILENAVPGDFRCLRIVTLAGEKADTETVRKSNFINPRITLVNEYGPTESTIGATALIGMTPDNTSIIGRPVANTRIYILNDNLILMPVGVRGELCIAGDGLARGYLKKPELTSEKFVACPYNDGERIYRTGDLARWLPDGNIEFSGRMDQQIKIRGFRIEIGEIESRLRRYDQVKEAAVIDLEDAKKEKYLCAYLVSNGKISRDDLRKHMLEELPAYMVPSYYIQLDRLPLTPNGKVDTGALPQPDISAILTGNYSPPGNELERKIQKIWQEILGIEEIGVNHDFFSLGGNSLKAMKIVACLENEMPLEVTDIYDNSTIRKLSGLLQKKLVYAGN